jgi:2-polyprenyl-3-methyl-5-hydroxy-6-metoxy-1,4-benzoquinol methylase
MDTEPSSDATYSAAAIARWFDEAGLREWERLVESPLAEVSLHLHTHYLEQFIQPGQQVLEIGAGAGRFTQVLARLGARLHVADISPVQLDLNRRHATHFGFAGAVGTWQQVDICEMGCLGSGQFEAVVAYGGPLRYALERRDRALQECCRVLRPGGLLFLSVMSLWGTFHRFLEGVMDLPPQVNQEITTSGDLTAATYPGRRDNFMHMFRASELQAWLLAAGLEVLATSASGCLSGGWNEKLQQIRSDPQRWQELLRCELEASAEPGALDMGTHLIAVARKVI